MSSTPTRPNPFALAALLFFALAILVFRAAPSGAAFPRDFEAYYAAGATWNAGGDPWSRDVWRVERTFPGVDATRDELLPFVGPAITLPLWSLLARLPLTVAIDAWLALLAFALGVLAVAAAILAGVALTPANAARTFFFAAIAGSTISDIALGQVALVAAAAVALTLLALLRRSPWAVLAALVAAVQPNVALPLAARLTERRSAAMLIAAAVLFVALTLALGGGVAGFFTYLHRLAEQGTSERFDIIQYGAPAILAASGVPRGAAVLAGNACALLAALAAASVAWRLRAQPLAATLPAIALVPWIVPFFHGQDFVVELIPAIVLAASEDARVRALAGVAAICIFSNWLGIAQRPDDAIHDACLIFAAACAIPLLPNRSACDASPWPPLAACVLLALIAVPLALASPAPVWPDTLGAFHAAANLDAAAVWAAEQRAAGLTAVLPATAVLRAVALAGCALLALAAYVAAEPSAITIRLPRTASGTAVSDSPSHGPASQ